MAIDWSYVYSLEVADGAGELTSVTDAMEEVIEANPELGRAFLNMLGGHLTESPDAETFDRINEGTTALWGLEDGPTGLLIWLVRSPDFDLRLSAVDAIARRSPPSVARLLRDTLALYGPRLNGAYVRWRELPENWMMMDRSVYYEALSEQHRIEIALTKYSGERISVTCNPSSLLVLTTGILATLQRVAGVAPLEAADVDRFREQVAACLQAIDSAREADAGVNQQPEVQAAGSQD